MIRDDAANVNAMAEIASAVKLQQARHAARRHAEGIAGGWFCNFHWNAWRHQKKGV
jgi:hypothetical protein